MSSSDDQPGDSKEQMPKSSGSGSSNSSSDSGVFSKLLDALKSLLSGGQGMLQAGQAGPDVSIPLNNNVTAPRPTSPFGMGPDVSIPLGNNSNPQTTPTPAMPATPQPTPMSGQAGIPPQMQLAMARQRLQPQQMAQPENMSKYQRPMGR